jgi:hypothetical protein
MPGVTTVWLASANGVSERTIRWRRARGNTPIADMPTFDLEAGLHMAQLRAKGAHLCLWTRLAIAERVKAGATLREAAEEFGVSIATAQRAVHRGERGYHLLTCTRTLTSSQIRNLKIRPAVSAGDT